MIKDRKISFIFPTHSQVSTLSRNDFIGNNRNLFSYFEQNYLRMMLILVQYKGMLKIVLMVEFSSPKLLQLIDYTSAALKLMNMEYLKISTRHKKFLNPHFDERRSNFRSHFIANDVIERFLYSSSSTSS